ncbi:hypothetical protein [Pantoea vagans]|uniref:hypothetical protein n=1 Tax=Pantoea vagans TaxID=470934 RepID=UPI00320B157F
MTRSVFPYPYVAYYRDKGAQRNVADYVSVRIDNGSFRVSAPVRILLGADNQREYSVVNGRLVLQ